jgi:hypothetical protein
MSKETEPIKVKTYHIFPPINFARVGNSDTGFIISPEKPGCGPTEFKSYNSLNPKRDPVNLELETPVTKFKDKNGKIKRQAARFRIFELTETYIETSNHNRVLDVKKQWREITSADAEIKWSVKLANRKGIGWSAGDGFNPDWYSQRNQLGECAEGGTDPITEEDLIIVQPEMTICGKNETYNQDKSETGTFKGKSVFLGELKTDANGNLLVLGGKGIAGFVNNSEGTIPEWRDNCHYNNEGWYDDTSDGTVSATVTFPNKKTHTTKGKARVIVAPPDYAPSPGVIGIITQNDQLVQVAKDGYEEERWGWKDYNKLMTSLDYPSFTTYIYPLIRAAKNLYWTIHTIHKNMSQFVSTDWLSLTDNTAKEAKLRVATVEQILALEGHLNFMKLTDVQKTMLQNYKIGNFENDWEEKEKGKGEQELMIKNLEKSITPDGLIEAALTQAMGGGFHPGWEGGKDFINIDHFSGPFRLKGPIGRFVENMAVPWQADLWGCRTWPNQEEDSEPWWPSHRPDSVLTKSIAASENRYFVNFSREDESDQVMVNRRKLIHNFDLLGFILPEIEESSGLWLVDGDLIERER